MPADVWHVLATDGVRSLVEVRQDGVLWVREGLGASELELVVRDLAARLYLVTPLRKVT